MFFPTSAQTYFTQMITSSDSKDRTKIAILQEEKKKLYLKKSKEQNNYKNMGKDK